MKYSYFKEGVDAPHEIFVFGSNCAGRHGKGAALVARKRFGAVYGLPAGIQGNSYAIPTKSAGLKTLPIGVIQNFVTAFKQYAKQFPEDSFFVTRIGCGLAGYKDSDIAPLFRDSPSNCRFDERWKMYLE